MRSPFFEAVFDLTAGAETLRRRPYGVIEAADGAFHEVRIRPFPENRLGPGGDVPRRLAASLLRRRPHLALLQSAAAISQFPRFALRRLQPGHQPGDRWPRVEALDEIARLKQSDALLCDAGNWRISAKLLDRLGWTPHCPSRWHRHYIKRFYGQYPRPSARLA